MPSICVTDDKSFFIIIFIQSSVISRFVPPSVPPSSSLSTSNEIGIYNSIKQAHSAWMLEILQLNLLIALNLVINLLVQATKTFSNPRKSIQNSQIASLVQKEVEIIRIDWKSSWNYNSADIKGILCLIQPNVCCLLEIHRFIYCVSTKLKIRQNESSTRCNGFVLDSWIRYEDRKVELLKK